MKTIESFQWLHLYFFIWISEYLCDDSSTESWKEFAPTLKWGRASLVAQTVKNLPAMQESSSQCRRHRFDPWSRKMTHAAKQLGLCGKTIEPVLWSLRATSMRPWATTTEACAPWSPCSATDTTAMRSPLTKTRERSLLTTTTEKPTQQWRHSTDKKK